MLLFSCGYRAANQEVLLFEHLISIIRKINSDSKFVLRPYPNIPDPSIYDRFKNKDGILLQENKTFGLIQSDYDVVQKKLLLENARSTINLGTTMSLEASFFNHPIIQIAYIPNHVLGRKRGRGRPWRSGTGSTRSSALFHRRPGRRRGCRVPDPRTPRNGSGRRGWPEPGP